MERQPPIWLENTLGHVPKPFTPKHLRLAAVARIAEGSGGSVVGVVMDPKDQQAGETPAEFFQRLEHEHHVEAYFVVIPADCKVLGTVFEGGMLVRDAQRGQRPYLAAFYDRTFANEDEDGRVRFTGPAAKGHRTDYLRDVAKLARHNEFWENYEELIDLMETRALGIFGF